MSSGASAGNQYVFLIAVTSSRPGHHFRSTETTFVKSMGSVLRAHWLQSRVVEADAAKTRFLSSISHEASRALTGCATELIRLALRSFVRLCIASSTESACYKRL